MRYDWDDPEVLVEIGFPFILDNWSHTIKHIISGKIDKFSLSFYNLSSFSNTHDKIIAQDLIDAGTFIKKSGSDRWSLNPDNKIAELIIGMIVL